MASRYRWIPLGDFRGGRNATNAPLSLAENQVVEMRNGDTFRTQLFRKRGGAAAPSIGSAFTAKISSLITHYPDNNQANAELWGVDDAATPVFGRMAAASTFSSVTLKDNLTPSTDAVKVRGASYGGKLFLAYNTAVDRLHVWDPTLGTPSVRRTGQDTPAAPTVANTGVGTYAAVIRYYRQRYRIKSGSTVVAQSEPSASTSFTPSGTGTAARVTKAAAISESETHWVVEASTDNVTFYQLSEIAVATTTYDDSAATSTYSANALSAVLGAYTVQKSVKYVIAAFNRILGMGTWESGNPQSRIYFSPAKGTADKGDDERVPDTLNVRNFLDLDEGTGGDGTGFAGPIYGAVYVFKYSQLRKILPTGGSNPVFDVVELSLTRGAIEQECIAVGEDANGRPAIFFLDSQLGPMVAGASAPTPIGEGVRDQWDLVNLAATTKTGWVLDYPAKGQVWFAWATGANNEPNILAIYTKLTGGWAVCDTGGKIRLTRCAALFARTPGASMSLDKVPYLGYSSTNNTLLRADTTDTDDNTTTFQALVKTRPYAWNNGQPLRTTTPYILAKAAAGVTLTVTADLDFGRETRSGTVLLTA
ncbi:MAG: hypothetical protein ACREJC_00095, partial [Tepidisphaeraceae bacterium]